MNSRLTRVLVGFVAALPMIASGCGSSNSSSNGNSGGSTGQLSMMVSDDPINDWAEIGVKVLSISLTPQGGGTPVVVYTAPNPVNLINLVELDQLADILDNVSVPAGTYTGAAVTLSANPGDVALTASSDPDPGFAGTPGATVNASQIQIVGATGSAGSLTVPLNVTFVSPVTITANQNSGIDFEFNLSHPAFIVAHAQPVPSQTIWAVNFNPALRHHPIFEITRLVLRHLYGSFVSISSDNASITVTRVFPVKPPTNPETDVATSRNLTILADKANGTLFYDLDAHTPPRTIMSFANMAGELNGKFLRIAARFQVDGSLVAVRIWASSSFNTVWLSPEGHVRHVLASSLVVDSEDGSPVTIAVDSNTQFFFRAPENPAADAKPFCTGTTCLGDMVRGFKVHITADPLQNPPLALSVDIEIARFDGLISAPSMANFIYTRNFKDSHDDYMKTMPYISSQTANGHDPLSGKAISGFKWWNFAFPTLQNNNTVTGDNPVPDFVSAVQAAANFGGTVPVMPVVGATYAIRNDPNANAQGWAAPWVVLAPTPVSLANVATGWVQNGTSDTFTITVPGGTNQVTIDASAVLGSATLVYQVDRTGGITTISPVDLTTSAGQNTVQTHLTPGTLVKVFGVPETSGHIKAYVFFYFTGSIMPAS
jgi:Domain of unknown function (DUF4382)